MNILLTGDSFAADWSVKYNDYLGWPDLLAQQHCVTNIAQAGISEYKILKQIESQCLNNYDVIIVCHTHWSRVHTRCNSLLHKDVLHKDADLLMADAMSKPWRMRTARKYFLDHWDEQYYLDIYALFIQQINKLLQDSKVISIKNFADIDVQYDIDATDLEKGLINHLSKKANQILLDRLTNTLDMLY